MKDRFNVFSKYWRTSARNWEAKRYGRPWSRFIYSSLLNRMQYLAFIIEQMPEGSHVIELGCGSGRLFDHIKNKRRLKYSGYDISPAAINEAQKRWKDIPDTTWSCCDISDIPQQSCDLVVSAGLLDWLTDEQIKILIGRIDAPYFAHSFSKKKNTVGVYVHIIFTVIQSILNNSKYDPRKFTIAEIKTLFHQSKSLSFIENKKLSFGCFVEHLPSSIESDFSQFKIKQYFESKGQSASPIERAIKSKEISETQKHLTALAGRNVLEIGSGTGVYSQILLNSDVRSLTAFDHHVETSAYVEDPRFRFVSQPFESLTLDETFDAAILFGVLEFVTNPEVHISRLAEVTVPKGRVLILYPKEQSLLTLGYRKYHKAGGRSLHFLTNQKLKTIFEKNGFAQVTFQSAGPVNNLHIFEKLHER